MLEEEKSKHNVSLKNTKFDDELVIKREVLKKKLLKEFLGPTRGLMPIKDEDKCDELVIKREVVKKKLLKGCGLILPKKNEDKCCIDGNHKQDYNLLLNKSIRVVLTQLEIREEYTKASLMYGNFNDASVDFEFLRKLKNLRKRELLKKKLLEGGKISLENNSSINNELGSESTIPIRIPKGGLAVQELIAPIYGISRHRILRDGDGVITLVAFSGCHKRSNNLNVCLCC